MNDPSIRPYLVGGVKHVTLHHIWDGDPNWAIVWHDPSRYESVTLLQKSNFEVVVWIKALFAQVHDV